MFPARSSQGQALAQARPYPVKRRPEIPTSRRYTLGFALSLALHALPAFPWSVFGLSWDMDVQLPEFELTAIELTDIDASFGEGEPEPQPEPLAIPEAAPPPPVETPEEGLGPEAAEEEPKEEVKPFGEKQAKLDKVGPPNAYAFAFLAARKASKLKAAPQLVELMAALPDFIYIIDGGGFNVLRDFDYLVIASPNPRAINATFVAVRYRLSQPEMQAGLTRAAQAASESVEWVEQRGALVGDPKPLSGRDHDPRVFVFLDDKTAIFVRREFLPAILAKHGKGDADDEELKIDDSKSMADFVANMIRLRRFSQREPNAAVIATVKDIRSKVKKGTAPFVVPDGLEMMIEASDTPEVVIKLDAVKKDEAKQLIKEWNEELPKLIDKVPFVVRPLVRGLYEGITVEQDRAQVTLRSTFTETQVSLLLSQATKGTRKIAERNKQLAGMDERAKQRDELWKARNGGKLTPSEALEKLREEQEAKAGGAGGAATPGADAPPQPLEVGPKKPLPGQPAGG